MSISMKGVKLRNDQRGMTSIMITMVMITMVSIIVLGFAQLARREQRQSLDNQLSTQAYYAAESGINDAMQEVRAAVASGATIPEDDSCNENASAKLSSNVQYTCLTINPRPSALNGVLSNDQGSVFRLYTGTTLSGIRISWKNMNGNPLSNCPTSVNDAFKPGSSWNCPFGVLRMDLARTDISPFSKDNLAANTTSITVLPGNGGGGVGAASINSKEVRVLANSCNATVCSVTINGLAGSEYYLNARTVYAAKTDVTITQVSANNFVGSQVEIDATGKAQDVLRRVRIAMNIFDPKSLDSYAVSASDGPCKHAFVTLNGASTIYSDAVCSEAL